MGNERIPYDDYVAGFIAGWQAVRGTAAAIPGIPGCPGIPGNMTPFLIGIKAGLRAAGVSI